MQSIDEASRFRDSSVESNFAASERAMKQIVYVFRHLGKAWKVKINVPFVSAFILSIRMRSNHDLFACLTFVK